MSFFMLLVATTLAIFILMASIKAILTAVRMWRNGAQVSSTAMFMSAAAGILLVSMMFTNPVTWAVLGITAMYTIAIDICRGILYNLAEWETEYAAAPITSTFVGLWNKGKTWNADRKVKRAEKLPNTEYQQDPGVPGAVIQGTPEPVGA